MTYGTMSQTLELCWIQFYKLFSASFYYFYWWFCDNKIQDSSIKERDFIIVGISNLQCLVGVTSLPDAGRYYT